ncbi:hypothetical protein Poli38472_004023 [Pythium oligandrum]|uniref:SAC domain-containing protein n=1 Tax=Pythium oligandrum TaxID=41045 RepID=A0A8K1CNQ5_PYTOL|nr:hypothetical protein Poli38472_004023 [Pythium oligandrum]|eukprot:TMW66258.1 hypothetical protein Poli38472_004023 [Pythium oligandrum]
MSIAGPLYRRALRPAEDNEVIVTWTLVWCELAVERGAFCVFPDAHSTQTRHLLVLPVRSSKIKQVRSNGRDCIEIKCHGKTESFSSHESSYDVDWWMNSLTAVKRDLAGGVTPQLSIVCPPGTDTPLRTKPRGDTMSSSLNSVSVRTQTRRRQPSLEATVTKFERYTIYETVTKFYVVCSDRHYTRFRKFSLERAVDPPRCLAEVLKEDPELYTWEEMEAQLQTLAEEAKAVGCKFSRAFTAVAIVGCIRFLRGYYFIFATQRRKIGCIGGNHIYGISATQQLSVSRSTEESTAWTWLNRWLNPSPEEEAEARYLGLFHFIDLTKDFFYSYSYDVTHTLQHNMTTDASEPCEMFTWNEYLTREFKSCLSVGASEDLIIPLVLGCYEQRKCSVFGRLVSITLVARRSRHFAGTRYLKRGVADTGKAANDVETEQIIEDENMGTGKFSSFVQYRGSIPVFWTQETSATLPKPPIVLNRIDPTYTASRKHFADLFSRYGSPTVALNLVKQSEKKEREVIVGNEFMNAVEYLNSFIPGEHRIRYVALDYSRLSKQKGLNVLHSLDKVAVWALTQTGFFCSAPKRHIGRQDSKQSSYVSFAPPLSREVSGATSDGDGTQENDEVSDAGPPESPTIPRKSGDWLEQKGVLRTNCIDCLDRTNVSQFSVGMRALGQQLYAMGIRNTPLLESRSQLVRVLMLLYSLVGDAISMQYGGSEAHKNVKNSAGRENVKGRELLTSIRRYYSNSFTDMAKQDAINIFLGHFVPKEGEPPLWELESDYYLHNFEVRNGTAACDLVRHTLEVQAENKRRALDGDVSPSSLAEAVTARSNERTSDLFDDHITLMSLTIRDKQKREAYVRECRRLLEDWWKEPLDEFERPKFCIPRDRPKRRPRSTKQGDGGIDSTLTDSMGPDGYIGSRNRLTKSLSVSSDTFLQMYHPEEMTSFTKTLGYKFMNIMDLSNESTNEEKTRSRSNTSSSIDASPKVGVLQTTRFSSIDEEDSETHEDIVIAPRSSAPNSRGFRSMSAPDIGDELLRSEAHRRLLEHNARPPRGGDGGSRHPEKDPRDAYASRDGAGFGRSFQIQRSSTRVNDDSTHMSNFLQGRSHRKKFVGDCSPLPTESAYERYVHWDQSFSLWETGNENVKAHFESYLRDNNISPDDARALREAQTRAGATFKIQTGTYSGLDQNVKARVLVAKKLRTDLDDRKAFEECLDYKRLMSSSKATIPSESVELYKSFFDQPLPEVPIYPKPDAVSATKNSSEQMAEILRTGGDKQRRQGVRGRYGDYDLILVGPLFKLNGGKDEDFILFNEAAAENAFADVIKNETELSFYAK